MSDFENYDAEEPAPDKDDFADPISTFPSMYHQQGSVAMGLDKSFVLHLAQCGDRVCAVTDTGTLCVYHLDTLSKTHTLKPHSSAVTGLTSCSTQPDLVMTCSSDQTVKVWDLRLANHSPVHTLEFSGKVAKQQPHSSAKPLSSVAVNTAGLVVAGTEQVAGETFLLFWDTRVGNTLMGAREVEC